MRYLLMLVLLLASGFAPHAVMAQGLSKCDIFGGTQIRGCIRPKMTYVSSTHPGVVFTSAGAAGQAVSAYISQRTNCNRGIFTENMCPLVNYTGYCPYTEQPLFKNTDVHHGIMNWGWAPLQPGETERRIQVCTPSNYHIYQVYAKPICPEGWLTSSDYENNNPNRFRYVCTPGGGSSNHSTNSKAPELFMSDDTNEDNCVYGCNPVGLSSLAKMDRVIDYQNNEEFPITWERTYNSRTGEWRFSYNQHLNIVVNNVYAFRNNGSVLRFTKTNGIWLPEYKKVLSVFSEILNHGQVVGYRLDTPKGISEFYDQDGRLTKIERLDGETHEMGYNSKGQLSSVYSASGHLSIEYSNYRQSRTETWTINNPIDDDEETEKSITYEYYNNNNEIIKENLPTVVKFNNQTVAEYSWVTETIDSYPISKLQTVVIAGEKMTGYLYGNAGARYSTHTDLVGIVDGNGNQYASYAYVSNRRGTIQSVSHGSSGDTVTYTSATFLDNNNQYVYFHNRTPEGLSTGQTAPCASCGGLQAKNIQYDTYGNPISITNFDNKIETRTYDGPRGLMTSQTHAAGTPLARAFHWTWHPTFPFPLTQTEPVDVNGASSTRTTTWTYNTKGKPLQQVVSVPNEISRTTVMTYTSQGDLETITHPNGRVEKIVYNNERQMIEHIDAFGTPLSRSTSFGSFDFHGNANVITTPDGTVVTLTRDGLQRIVQAVAVNQGLTLTSTTEYDFAGLMTKQTLPNGTSLHYTYDDAHRLIRTTTKNNNVVLKHINITYTTGNKVAGIQVTDANLNVDYSQTHGHDQYRRLTKDIDAHNHTTQRTLTLQGVTTQQTDALGRVSKNTIDALNRVTQILDPMLGTSSFVYDVQDQITKATDRKGVQTHYAYNGFGDITQINSTDRGVWDFAYNSFGQLTQVNDPLGGVQTLTYDILGRTLSSTFTRNGTVAHTYAYDTCNNGLGKICTITWPQGSKIYSYDPFGRLTQMVDQSGVVSLTTQYAYDQYGRNTSITYPSGKVLHRTYHNGRLVSLIYDGRVVADNIAWNSMDQVKSFDWSLPGFTGMGQQFHRDSAGLITSVVAQSGTREYIYDNGHRITQINQSIDPQSNQTNTYNLLDQLTKTSVVSWNDWLDYTYDMGGNRTKTVDSSGTGKSFLFDLNSNRLLARQNLVNNTTLPAQPVTTDNMGNITSYSGNTLEYDASGRLVQFDQGLYSTSFTYNPLGQRQKKIVTTNNQTETFFEVHDIHGQLLGVYTLNNGVIETVEELVMLEQWQVIATIRPNGANMDVYPIVSDHQGTPRQILSPVNQEVVWSWNATEAFGAQAPNENVSGTTFIYDGRFPGQRFDKSTGVFHNGWRTYDPTLGRYIQSDPLGLEAGWNTYAYVGSNPFGGIDPEGLEITEPKDNSFAARQYRSSINHALKSPSFRQIYTTLYNDPNFQLKINASTQVPANIFSFDNTIHWNPLLYIDCGLFQNRRRHQPTQGLIHEYIHAYNERQRRVLGIERPNSSYIEHKIFTLPYERKIYEELGMTRGRSTFEFMIGGNSDKGFYQQPKE